MTDSALDCPVFAGNKIDGFGKFQNIGLAAGRGSVGRAVKAYHMVTPGYHGLNYLIKLAGPSHPAVHHNGQGVARLAPGIKLGTFTPDFGSKQCRLF